MIKLSISVNYNRREKAGSLSGVSVALLFSENQKANSEGSQLATRIFYTLMKYAQNYQSVHYKERIKNDCTFTAHSYSINDTNFFRS
jgi:hypothetical protein